MKNTVAPGAARKAKPHNPQKIRELLCQDVSAVSDTELIALILANGTRARGAERPSKKPAGGWPKNSWSSVELAAALLEEAGGRLADLVQATCVNALDWRVHGVGKNIGARLIAAMELAERWRLGAGTTVGGSTETVEARHLSLPVFQRRRMPSPVELVALIVGFREPDLVIAEQVITAFGSLRGLVANLSMDAFESTQRRGRVFLRLPGSDLDVELPDFCRLVAAVEVARRYRGRPLPDVDKPVSLGLTSESLEKLLDPATPLEPELRQSLIEQLRSHPELTADFARLDRLAGDAATDNYQRAAEIHQMFHVLASRQGWQRPEEIVGEPVPYRGLLSMARATLERATDSPARLHEVKGLLESAEREAAAQPVAAFVDALRGLSLSESGADRAFEEARRGYLGAPL